MRRLGFWLALCWGAMVVGSCLPGLGPVGEGDPAPDFRLLDPAGHPVRRADLLGHWAVVHFWLASCAPCRVAMPRVDLAVEQHAGDDLRVLGINAGEDLETVVAFCRRMGLRYPMALDPAGEARAAFGVARVPVTFFLDPEGRIVERLEAAPTEFDLRRHLARRAAAVPGGAKGSGCSLGSAEGIVRPKERGDVG